MSNLYIQHINQTAEILRGLTESLNAVKPTNFYCCVAYATLSGCRELNENFQKTFPKWRNAKKEWLIGLDNGVTDPEALTYLSNLENSEVYVYNAEEVLANKLKPENKFHTKLYIFESDTDKNLCCFSTSANLTYSGLFINTEQADSFFAKSNSSQIKHQIETIKNILQSSNKLSKNILDRYKELHNLQAIQHGHKNEDERILPKRLISKNPELKSTSASRLATAKNFWVEIRYVVQNLGKGSPGNQIDLQRGSRVFFGFSVDTVRRNTIFGKIFLHHQNKVFECNMRFGNNMMDKLNLPIPAELGIDSFENKILVFKRKNHNNYSISVQPLTSINHFRNQSGISNSLFKMKGGREYGVY